MAVLALLVRALWNVAGSRVSSWVLPHGCPASAIIVLALRVARCQHVGSVELVRVGATSRRVRVRVLGKGIERGANLCQRLCHVLKAPCDNDMRTRGCVGSYVRVDFQ